MSQYAVMPFDRSSSLADVEWKRDRIFVSICVKKDEWKKPEVILILFMLVIFPFSIGMYHVLWFKDFPDPTIYGRTILIF